MIMHISALDEDLALKRLTQLPSNEKEQFAWSDGIDDNKKSYRLQAGNKIQEITSNALAEIVGEAFANLLRSRKETNIFTPDNQRFVAQVVQAAHHQLDNKADQAFSWSQIYQVLEKILVQHDAYDVAKSLIFVRAGRAEDQARLFNLEGVRLIRRSGQVVPWVQDKVEVAIRKAFLSKSLNSAPSIDVANAVAERIKGLGVAFVHIEDVQEIVQEELMRMGHFKVAEAYILYRAQRAAQREKERFITLQTTPQEEQSAFLMVQQASGENVLWDGSELRKRIEFAMIGLELCLSREAIEAELRRSLYSEISEADLNKTIILNAKALMEKDADFAKFAGRILLTYIYEEVLGWDIRKDGMAQLKALHQKAFKRYIAHGVAIERLHKGLLEYDLDQLAEGLDPSADLDFDYLGIQTLYDRYLIVDKTQAKHKRIETPQFFWMRVAMGLFRKEPKNREEWVLKLYNLYKSRRYCSSTPTLFNAGTLHEQLSSCYLYTVEDSLESIMYRGIADNAFLAKWAGGLGGSWTAVRGTGSYIKGTNGESQGVIPFLKIHNDQLVAVNQGGKRRGTGCAYLETWHSDILDFLELRRNTGDERRRTHDMNTANWVPDLFMKRVEARAEWTLFRSNETPDLHESYGSNFEKRYADYEAKAARGEIFGQKIPAIDLWKKMLSMLFETGHPWITFKDPCNIRSPQDHVGVIHSSNLCTEITLNTSAEETAVCNLGSVVLDEHLNENGTLDHERLRQTIHVAIRALDNVIDMNFYPTKAAETSNLRHRPIGLGVMGLQNALYKKKISFASEEAVEFNDEFMEAIAYYAYEASSDLAKERGAYSTYKGSKWDRGLLPPDTVDLLEKERGIAVNVPRGGKLDWAPLRAKIATQGMRNSNVLAIAPTATISNIVGTTPCIEPSYKNLYVKSNLSGDFIILNAFLAKELKALGLWNPEMVDNLKYFDGELEHIDAIPEGLKARYATAFSVDYDYVLAAAARRQKWIDQSQSVNLFLAEPDMKVLSHMYRAAWHYGLKTTYYLRTMGASNIEKATISVKKDVRGTMGISTTPTIDSELPETMQACRIDALLRGEECEACQ
jgi:ribonucleoside-diphosphate reductase alpha chain